MSSKTISVSYLLLLPNLLIARLAGPLSPGLTKIFVLILLLGSMFALSGKMLVKSSIKKIVAFLGVFVVGISIFLFTEGGAFIQIPAVVLIYVGMSKAVESVSPVQTALYQVLALCSFLFGLLYLIAFVEPNLWLGLQLISSKLSVLAGELSGQGGLLSSTASGINISILFIIFGGCAFAAMEHRSWQRLLLYFTGILLCNVLFIIVVHSLALLLYDLGVALGFSSAHSGHVHTGDFRFTDINPMNLLIFLPLLQAVPLALFLRKQRFRTVSKNLTSNRWLPVVACALLLIIGMSLIFAPVKPGQKVAKNVLLYDTGYLSWKKPVHGTYGLRSGGMFGMLPAYLESMGYSVNIDSTLSEKSLADVGVIVVINLNEKISAAEKQSVQEFVNNGGALLALGDHTGINGIREPFNDLLDFAGIRFRFDSAHYLQDKWRYAFDYLPGNLFYRVKDKSDLGISIGASLDLSPGRASPLLLAKYGFSDLGNALNPENAFLGDRFYNPGELLGDIVLIAATRFGEGKVLVFGDTSSFQNGELMQTFPFVQNVFNYLTGSIPGWLSQSRRYWGIFALLMALVLLLGFAYPLRNPAFLLLFILASSLPFKFLTTRTNQQLHPTQRTTPVAYVDAAHLNRFTHYGEEGVWALCYNLMRSDYLPFVYQEFTPEALKQSELAFVIAPARQLEDEEITALTDYMRKGGAVIWTVGYEEKSTSAQMLNQFGLDLDNRPLGSIPASETNSGAKFYEAWPIIPPNAANIDTLDTGWGYPVMVSKNVGEGKFILIADSGFLLSENIEQDESFTRPNVEFLRSFFDNYKNGGKLTVK